MNNSVFLVGKKYKSKDIKSKEVIKCILDSQKELNKYINTLSQDSCQYESLCESIQDRCSEIEEALIGYETYNEKNRVKAMLRVDSYWDYIKGEISWKDFVEAIKKHSSNLLIDLDGEYKFEIAIPTSSNFSNNQIKDMMDMFQKMD